MTDTTPVILHVEDNLAHAGLVSRCLERSAVAASVRLVADGEAALDYLFRRGKYSSPETSPRPQVILLDLRLPKVDGLEVLRIVKADAELCAIPVVVFTSSEADRDVADAYLNHGNSYLVKPMEFTILLRQMEAFAAYWLGWNWPAAPSPEGDREPARRKTARSPAACGHADGM